MDIAKLKKILSVIAVIAIVIIVIYNSGILGGNGENDGSSDYPAGTSQISDNPGLSNQGSSQQNGTGSEADTSQQNGTGSETGTGQQNSTGSEADTSHQNGTGSEADASQQNGTGSEADTSNQIGNGSDTDATAATDPGADADTAGQGSAELPADTDASTQYTEYFFRSNKLLTQHYEKHGIEMGFDSKESYEKAASDVINNPAALHKLEAEDGDYVYYLEDTNEFVILSQDGYIRTYFLPSAGKAYYERQ